MAARFFALALLVCLLWSADARKTTHPKPHAVHKQHDAAHASRHYSRHTDSRSGRTGLTHDRLPVAGRKLQQGSTVTVPGMNLCVSAADAANVIVGAHASQLTVSNAIFSKGLCDLASYQAGVTGLQWGVVQSWPADHVMASISNSTGGLVLGSGDVTEVQRVVNDADGFTADNQLQGDADLDALIPGYNTFDAVSLEFDVTPTKSGELVFSWVMFSEEYNEWVGSPFNDVFGFWISGPGIAGPNGTLNVAYMPDQVTACSINNVNNNQLSQFYHDNDLEPRPTTWPPPSPYNTSYDGFTTLLTTRPVTIQAGQTYHFKLAVADAGDHVLDSAVWIAGGSLLVNSPPRVDNDGPYALACPGSITMYANATDDDHDAVRFSWDLMSTTGVHLTRLTQAPTLTLPDDNIPTGNYTVKLTAIDMHGSRGTTQSTLTVLACPAPATNRPPVAQLTGAPYTMAVCNGVGSVVMDASASSDSDAGDAISRYVWEVAAADVEFKLTGPTVTVSAAQGLFAGNTYEVEVYVSDKYGAVGTAETTLTVVPSQNCQPVVCSGSGCTAKYTEAFISNAPYEVPCSGSLTLDGSASTSFDGNPLTYAWEVTGSSTPLPVSSSPTMAVSMDTLSWMQPGVAYTVQLTVTDSQGSAAYDYNSITIPSACQVPNNPPTAVLTSSSYSLPCGGVVTMDGSGSNDPDAGDAVAAYSWEIYDKAGNLVTTGSESSLTADNTVLPPGTTYDVYLTVTDTQGAVSNPAKATLKAPTCSKPPVAKLSGGPYTLKCGGSTGLDGTASSDPDGNDDIKGYTFYVKRSDTQEAVATLQSANGKATVTQAAGISSNTQYLIVLEVRDAAGNIGTANSTLTVGNCNPTAVMAITPSTTITCGGTVTLDGSKSSDSDGSIASYSWKLLYGNQTVSKSGATAVVSQATDKLTPGVTYSVQLTVKDNLGGSSSSSSSSSGVLTVQAGCVPPNNPPVCTNAKPSVTRISTLDHSMKSVSITGVTDPDADAITIKITGVTQDEPVKGSDLSISGTWACPDAKIASTPTSVTLASECLNAKATTVSGRVYSIQYTATDSKGASCSGSVSVCAKPGTSGSCVDDGQLYNSVVCA